MALQDRISSASARDSAAPNKITPRGSKAARSATTADTLVVLQSGPRPLPTTNPYNIMLARAIESLPGIDFRYFSWREALTKRHAVFHAHWPEAMLTSPVRWRALARQAVFALLLLKWRVNRTAIVRTEHNIGLPRDISWREVLLLRAFERQTAVHICLNKHTPVPDEQTRHIVPHGDYRPWYDGHRRSSTRPGRIAYFGMIRRYKGVDRLITAFKETADPGLSLSIGGKPSTPELGAEMLRLAKTDPRIDLVLDFLDDPALVRAITEAELVVLPHPEMHNSGSALAALSLDRPVLVQDNPVNRDLQAEVGRGWVHLYSGTLTGQDLEAALREVRINPPSDRPRLEDRDWQRSAALHEAAYRHAVSLIHAHRRSRNPITS